MNIPQIDPKKAYDLLQSNPDAVYIDVRTEQEFKNGHAPGARNIPVAMPDPVTRQMALNPAFVKTVEAEFAKDRKLIMGCQMGGRSQRAAEMLAQVGYADVSNMQGGFGGAVDPMGRVSMPGWVQLDLPVER